jgi:hypothetical protein
MEEDIAGLSNVVVDRESAVMSAVIAPSRVDAATVNFDRMLAVHHFFILFFVCMGSLRAAE